MSATAIAAARAGDEVAAAANACCFHCGDALADGNTVTASIDGTAHDFCCAGCAAAAAWIHQAHLDDYYRLRTATAGRVEPDGSDFSAWDRDDVIGAHVHNVPDGREIVLATDGMHCAACAWLIDRALSREAGVREISANAVTGRIRLVWNPARSPLSSILTRLQALGYRPYLAGDLDSERARRREHNRWLLRLGLAGIVALQTMMFAEALYLDSSHQMPLATRDFFRWLTFLLATPVVFYAGFPFLAGAWHELTQRRAGMDTLVAGSTLLAWGASTFETLRGGAQVWFDAAVMFVFLLLAARVLEMRARQVAGSRIEALARARPVLAQRERLDATATATATTSTGTGTGTGTGTDASPSPSATGCVTEEVPLAQLQPGDIVRVAAGEHVPADGVLVGSAAALDESLLTGEARPVPRAAGDAVLAGSICAEQSIRIRVTAAGAATRLSALARLVQRAQEHRPRLARDADRIASWFVLGIVVLAALVYLYWRATDPARAFEVALAMLVISCPCALSLAVPAALAAAYSRLSALGVLVLRPDALQQLAAIDTVVFDKTGTLGDGAWRIESIDTFDGCDQDTARQLAAALEHGSLHPIASAFRPFAGARGAQDVKRLPGLGIAGVVAGRPLRLGTAAFAAARADDGAVWLGDGHTALARFELREQPRADSAATLQQLAAQGLHLQLLSGDALAAVQRFAAQLPAAFEHAEGRLLPEDKLARVRELQAAGHHVLMIGDGINDAPVLGGADVSIAVSGGAALARQSADVVLLNPSLTRVVDGIGIARRTRRVIRQNLGWAIAYNLVALPIAASGHIAPWAAALAMVVSSLTVTLNALRLARAGAATSEVHR